MIEVVSPKRVARDHGTKLSLYEAHGVPEYRIIDSVRHEARLFVLAHDVYKPADL